MLREMRAETAGTSVRPRTAMHSDKTCCDGLTSPHHRVRATGWSAHPDCSTTLEWYPSVFQDSTTADRPLSFRSPATLGSLRARLDRLPLPRARCDRTRGILPSMRATACASSSSFAWPRSSACAEGSSPSCKSSWSYFACSNQSPRISTSRAWARADCGEPSDGDVVR